MVYALYGLSLTHTVGHGGVVRVCVGGWVGGLGGVGWVIRIRRRPVQGTEIQAAREGMGGRRRNVAVSRRAFRDEGTAVVRQTVEVCCPRRPPRCVGRTGGPAAERKSDCEHSGSHVVAIIFAHTRRQN